MMHLQEVLHLESISGAVGIEAPAPSGWLTHALMLPMAIRCVVSCGAKSHSEDSSMASH